MANNFNFSDVKEKAIKVAEQEIEQGFKKLSEEGSGEAEVNHQTEQPASSVQTSIYQEPMQNINIPVPMSLHTRLKITAAQTKGTMKDMVVQAIDLWLDVQEGNKKVVGG